MAGTVDSFTKSIGLPITQIMAAAPPFAVVVSSTSTRKTHVIACLNPLYVPRNISGVFSLRSSRLICSFNFHNR